MRTELLGVALLLMVACTSSGVKEIEDDGFQAQGQADDGKVGINDRRQIVIKQETPASTELVIQESVNLHLQEELGSELHMLGLCRRDLGDRRLGGSGQIARIPAVDNLRPVSEVREKLGVDDSGDLKIVRERSFEETLRNGRRYEGELRKMLKVIVEQREECENRMSQARLKVGLPSNRYQGDGFFAPDGTYVPTRPNENNLDDAFAIREKLKNKT